MSRKNTKLILFSIILIIFSINCLYSQSISLGDINNDGIISIVDSLLAAQYYVGINPPFINLNAGDVDADSKVTIIDALLIAQYYVGMIESFPADQKNTSGGGNSKTSLSDMPPKLHSSIEWVWKNRILVEGSTNRKNLIFDQIFAGKGKLNYIIRWQSHASVSFKQRQEIASMIKRQINNWTQHLSQYDGWPYKNIDVRVIGWAAADKSLLKNLQSHERVYTTWQKDDLHNQHKNIPIELPYAPSSCSRFDHFRNSGYTYSSCPQGSEGRFDMYLWCTENFGGGAGGDWGQRMSDKYILNNLKSKEVSILEHEIGHGFGLTDFYGADQRPPGGFPVPTIMWAGNSGTITEWDKWMLRYVWSQLKKQRGRFIN